MSKSQYAPKAVTASDTDMRIAIVKAKWNEHITGRLADSAVARLKSAGLASADIQTFEVPGAVELTFGASSLIETGAFDAVIVFGCVIRGGTPHFDYVCQSVTQGITSLNADCDTPVIFGVLTVDNEQDALDRCGGSCGDKGAEAADAAIAMVNFKRLVADI